MVLSSDSIDAAGKTPPPSSPPMMGSKRTHDDMEKTNNNVKSEQRASPIDLGSGEGSQDTVDTSQSRTLKPPSGQRPKSDDKVQEDEDLEVDPAEQIEHFDWMNLEERYHDAINARNKVEDELSQEFVSLMEFFGIWASANQTHETDRSFKRLRTRMAHVQHSEEELEATRLHYVQVVKAFESALQLLNQR